MSDQPDDGRVWRTFDDHMRVEVDRVDLPEPGPDSPVVLVLPRRLAEALADPLARALGGAR